MRGARRHRPNAAHLVESGGALANLKTLLEPQNDDEKGELQKMAAEALVKLRCDLGEAGADVSQVVEVSPSTNRFLICQLGWS